MEERKAFEQALYALRVREAEREVLRGAVGWVAESGEGVDEEVSYLFSFLWSVVFFIFSRMHYTQD